MQARGFVRDAAEVGRVWGSFRRSRFRREGGDVFGFHTETSTGRSYRRTSTSNHELDLAVSDRRAAVGPRVWILWTFHTAVWHLAAYGGYRVVLGAKSLRLDSLGCASIQDVVDQVGGYVTPY
jgi:hypothetical protein